MQTATYILQEQWIILIWKNNLMVICRLHFKNTKSKFCVISFSSDWLYPTIENKEIVIALNACGANVGFVEINSDKGHDSFLLECARIFENNKRISSTQLHR